MAIYIYIYIYSYCLFYTSLVRIFNFFHIAIVDHTHGGSIDNAATINFASFKNVADAFAALMRVCTMELECTRFEIIHTVCLTRADRRLRNEIGRTTNIHNLSKLLASNPLYFNWMDVGYLEAMAVASGNGRNTEFCTIIS